MTSGVYDRKIKKMNQKQINYFKLHSSPRWIVKDLNDNIIESFRTKNALNNLLPQIRKEKGFLKNELKIEKI